MAKTVGLIFPIEPVKKAKGADSAHDKGKKDKSIVTAPEEAEKPAETDDAPKSE